MSHFHEAQSEADLPISHQGEFIEDDPEPDEPQDDSSEEYTRFEDTTRYRDQLIDAGRGHLVGGA